MKDRAIPPVARMTQESIRCSWAKSECFFHVYKYGYKIICLTHWKHTHTKLNLWFCIQIYKHEKNTQIWPEWRMDSIMEQKWGQLSISIFYKYFDHSGRYDKGINTVKTKFEKLLSAVFLHPRRNKIIKSWWLDLDIRPGVRPGAVDSGTKELRSRKRLALL